MNDLYAQIQSAANAGATGLNGYAMPTPAQLQSGNYRKGRVRLYGLDIAIETPQGQPRLGKSDGKPWRVICMAHYGDISGTRGADGDPVDCYVGPSPESNRVFVVNQNGKDGAFDEHKVMLAFADEDAARAAYMGSYERGWTGLGSMVSATVEQFRWWLKFGDTTKPFSKNALPYDGDDDMTDITWDSAGMPANSDLATILYGLRLGDREDGLLLDAVQMSDILEDADSLDILDALVVENAKLGMKMEQLQRIMDATGETVKPISMQISEPFKQKGTTNVTALFELSDGQTVAIFFHNPDSTPNKILPQDELVSWKWLLNKKDVTILVAPEKGRDLNPREVARRIMRLAEKNSAKFQKANSARAERLAGIEQAKGAVAEKESTLASLDAEIADLTAKVEAKRANQAPDPAAPLGVSAAELATGSGSVEPESIAAIARRLIPAEFKTIHNEPDDFSAVAEDGYGIRVQRTASGKSTAAYILLPGGKGQDAMGAKAIPPSGPEGAISVSVDVALSSIARRRAAEPVAAVQTVETLAAEQAASLTDGEKESLLQGFMPSRIADAASAAGLSPKAVLSAMQDIVEAQADAREPESVTFQVAAATLADATDKAVPFGKLYSASDYRKQISNLTKALIDMGFKKWQAESIIESAKTESARNSSGRMNFLSASYVVRAAHRQGYVSVDTPAASVEQHYSDVILDELVAVHGWRRTDTGSLSKDMGGADTAGELNPEGKRIVYAAFDAAGRYLALKSGFDNVFEMDCRDLEPTEAAATFNARVAEWADAPKGNPAADRDAALAKFAAELAPFLTDDEIATVRNGAVPLKILVDAEALGFGERRTNAALKDALDAELARAIAEGDTDLKGFEEIDLSELRKKPAAASIREWFRVNSSEGVRWSAGGAIVDFANESPAIRGWESRKDASRDKDTPTVDADRIKPSNTGPVLGPVAIERGITKGRHAVYLESAKGDLAAVDLAYAQYFLSQYKDRAELRLGKLGAVGVFVGGEAVGVIAAMRSRKNIGRVLSKFKAGVRAPQAEAEQVPAEAAPEQAPVAAQSRADWQTAVTEALADSLEIPYSDADGVLEAHAGLLDEQYSKGAAPEDVAKMIEGMELVSGEPADPHEAVSAELEALGFKRVQPNDWASPAFEQENGGTKGFNVRASGEPAKYRLSFRVTFPGITGASQDVGTYETVAELMQVVARELAGAGAAPADDQSQAARELLQSVIDGTADLDEGLTERLEAVHDQFQGDAEIMALFEQAANAFSDAMVAKAKAALA